MKALTKDMLTTRDTLAAQLCERHGVLEKAVETFNEMMERAWQDVHDAQEHYNGAVAEANGWLADVAEVIADYISERSEKWLESDRGQAYSGWQDEYATFELEEVDLDPPDALYLDTGPQVDELEGRSEEAPV